jgi:hypothetical protein
MIALLSLDDNIVQNNLNPLAAAGACNSQGEVGIVAAGCAPCFIHPKLYICAIYCAVQSGAVTVCGAVASCIIAASAAAVL